MNKKKKEGRQSLGRSFACAARGIGTAVLGERNLRIHLAAVVAVVGAGQFYGFSTLEWAVLALTMGLVIGMELLNTAVETLTDLASPTYHPLAKAAKDTAAGAVLAASLAGAAVGLLFFTRSPGLRRLLEWLTVPAGFTTAGLWVLGGLVFVFVWPAYPPKTWRGAVLSAERTEKKNGE